MFQLSPSSMLIKFRLIYKHEVGLLSGFVVLIIFAIHFLIVRLKSGSSKNFVKSVHTIFCRPISRVGFWGGRYEICASPNRCARLVWLWCWNNDSLHSMAPRSLPSGLNFSEWRSRVWYINVRLNREGLFLSDHRASVLFILAQSGVRESLLCKKEFVSSLFFYQLCVLVFSSL
jgi:hypothetical protein